MSCSCEFTAINFLPFTRASGAPTDPLLLDVTLATMLPARQQNDKSDPR